jgi:hypothetical protein
MKLTESRLRQIIREELKMINEYTVLDSMSFEEALKKGVVERDEARKLFANDFAKALGSEVAENCYRHPYETLQDLPFEPYAKVPSGYDSKEEYIQKKGITNPQNFLVKAKDKREVRHVRIDRRDEEKYKIKEETQLGLVPVNDTDRRVVQTYITYTRGGVMRRAIHGYNKSHGSSVDYPGSGPMYHVDKMLEILFKGRKYFR